MCVWSFRVWPFRQRILVSLWTSGSGAKPSAREASLNLFISHSISRALGKEEMPSHFSCSIPIIMLTYGNFSCSYGKNIRGSRRLSGTRWSAGTCLQGRACTTDHPLPPSLHYSISLSRYLSYIDALSWRGTHEWISVVAKTHLSALNRTICQFDITCPCIIIISLRGRNSTALLMQTANAIMNTSNVFPCVDGDSGNILR